MQQALIEPGSVQINYAPRMNEIILKNKAVVLTPDRQLFRVPLRTERRHREGTREKTKMRVEVAAKMPVMPGLCGKTRRSSKEGICCSNDTDFYAVPPPNLPPLGGGASPPQEGEGQGGGERTPACAVETTRVYLGEQSRGGSPDLAPWIMDAGPMLSARRIAVPIRCGVRWRCETWRAVSDPVDRMIRISALGNPWALTTYFMRFTVS
jgi:hypothetical protein